MNASATQRPLAVVTGASSGIGYELALCAANDGYDLLIAADNDEIVEAACKLAKLGKTVHHVQVDLSARVGVDTLCAMIGDRPVDILLANAGHGLGGGFLDQDVKEWRHVIDTNITGTLYLIHKIANDMREAGTGKILITGSIAGFMPGAFQAVYNGTKAFIDSFSFALRNELKDTGVTITCLMPGATETEFFKRADMLDTKVGAAEKADPAEVAKLGFNAMMNNEGEVIAGFKNKIQAGFASIAPSAMTAEMHRSMAEPGSAKKARH